MSKSSYYPIVFEPVYKDYIWGGSKIAEVFHRQKKKEIIAESWEISDRDNGMSVVINGPLQGKTLHELVMQMKENLYGEGHFFSRFPILLKILDAKEKLSVQVHPADEEAQILGDEAKEECWYALQAEEKAKVYVGLKKQITRSLLEKAIQEKKVPECIEEFSVKKGDVFHIPGGTVHAVGAGCLLLEVQQNSSTTYRIYDWDRVDSEGKSRELHIDKAMQAINWKEGICPLVKPKQLHQETDHESWSLIDSPYFQLEKIHMKKEMHWISNHTTFEIIFSVSGKGEVIVDGNSEPLISGRSYLIPAAASEISISPKDPLCEVLRISLPPATLKEKVEALSH